MKSHAIAKTIAVVTLFAGALCWTAAADDGTDLWNSNCAACHGKDGKGQTTMGRKLSIKDLTDGGVQGALTDDQAVKDIKEGISQDGSVKMKAFGDKLSDDQIKALVAKVRSFKK